MKSTTMTDRTHEEPSNTGSAGHIDVRNIGEPIRVTGVKPLAGMSAEAAKGGQRIKLWTRLALTSDDPLFHRLADNLVGVVQNIALRGGAEVNLRRTDTLLLLLKEDQTAEIWADTAAVSLRCSVKRSMKAGAAIMEKDIADVTGMEFPCVEIGERDQVVCLFRQDWRFGLAFDFNPDGRLDTEWLARTLGGLYRRMRYKHLYDAIADTTTFDRLLSAGWFPFAEIVKAEFSRIIEHCDAGLDLSDIEDEVVSNFDSERTEGILARWVNKPHFSEKYEILQEAIFAFDSGHPVAVIKILLTEIEGVLRTAYRTAHGDSSAKVPELLSFAEQSAETKAGGTDTLLFPREFGEYLKNYTFAKFDPRKELGGAGSRHAVGHGAASQESYTMARALQTILTLDQLAFYT